MDTEKNLSHDGPLISPTLVTPSSILERIERQRVASVSMRTYSQTCIDFDIIDIYDRSSERLVYHRICNRDSALGHITSDSSGVRVRIISIPGLGTTSPLCMSFDLSCQMMVHYEIESQFRDILYSFGHAPGSGEAGCPKHFARVDRDQCTTVGYEVQYVEQNHRSRETPWSRRHTGVYHRASLVKDEASGVLNPFDFFIFVHSTFDTTFREHLHSILTLDDAGFCLCRRICKDPTYVHEMILDSHLSHWRWYLVFCGEKYDKESGEIFATDHPQQKPEILGFEPVRRLRFIRDEVIIANTFCAGNARLIDFLTDCRLEMTVIEPYSYISTMKQRVQDYLSSLAALQKRLENTLALLEYSLNLKNEATNTDANVLMHRLGEDTHRLTRRAAEDGASMKVITYMGLSFLPGTFVSGVFGENFFEFDQNDRSLVITPMFWIYIVVWIPLTLLILITYEVTNRHRRKNQRNAV